MLMHFILKYANSHIYEIYATISGLVSLIITLQFKKHNYWTNAISFLMGSGVFVLLAALLPQIDIKLFSTCLAGMLPLAVQLFWFKFTNSGKWRIGLSGLFAVCLLAEFEFMLSTASHYKLCYAIKIFVVILAFVEMLRSIYGYVDDDDTIKNTKVDVKEDSRGHIVSAKVETSLITKVIGTILVLAIIAIIAIDFIFKNFI